MKPSKEVANNWALRDPLESACHLGECTFDIHLAGFWAPVGRKWNARSPCSQRGGEEWVVYSEVIKAFLALKMTEECLELETQWCKSNVVIVFCPETLEALNILLGSGWSASEHLTQCREARKRGCYADCWARWFSTGWVVWPQTQALLNALHPSVTTLPKWERSARTRPRICEGGSFTTWIKSPSVSCFLYFIFPMRCFNLQCCQLLQYSKVMQLYAYVSIKFFSIMGYHRRLNIVACAIQ